MLDNNFQLVALTSVCSVYNLTASTALYRNFITSVNAKKVYEEWDDVTLADSLSETFLFLEQISMVPVSRSLFQLGTLWMYYMHMKEKMFLK